MDGLPRGVLVGTVNIVGCLRLKEDDSQATCFQIDRNSWLLCMDLGKTSPG